MASIAQEFNLKVDMNALIDKLVMTMLGTSSTLTIGDRNKKLGLSRVLTWIQQIVALSCFIAGIAATTYSVFSEPSNWDSLFPWGLSVALLLNTYLAVVHLAMGYLSLFVPQAPFAAWEALYCVGFKGIGIAAMGACFVVGAFFEQALHMYFACLLGVLIAAVLALWVWLVRTYGALSPLDACPR